MDKNLRSFDNQMFTKRLTEWYETNKRVLPWRETSDPYRIWVSEIMLQQTKVDTVIDYYHRFLEKYPTIFDLAAATEEDVLKSWEGLGYYSRARNLHTAAKDVVTRFDGKVPDNPKSLGALKGVGPYTMGAVSSIAFGQAEPAVDGNVMRVLSRVLYIEDNISDQKTRKRFEQIVRELIQFADPSAFNQGLMELGALVCTPRKPLCLHCPVNTMCRAHEVGETERLPMKLKKKKQRIEHYIVLAIQDDAGNFAIEKRPDKGLLANMWQFPMVAQTDVDAGELRTVFSEQYGMEVKLGEHMQAIKHVFTHIIWHLDVYHATCEINGASSLTFVTQESLADYPISVSHQKIVKHLK